MREGDACQHGLTCANCVTESFTEKICPSPPAGVAGLGVIHPETDAPHGVKRAGLQPNVRFQCSEGAVGADSWLRSENLAKGRTASSRTRSQIAWPKLRTPPRMRFVRSLVWRGHGELLGAAVLEKASLFRLHILLRAGIRHVVNGKRRWGPLRKTGRGLPEQHHLLH